MAWQVFIVTKIYRIFG